MALQEHAQNRQQMIKGLDHAQLRLSADLESESRTGKVGWGGGQCLRLESLIQGDRMKQ